MTFLTRRAPKHTVTFLLTLTALGIVGFLLNGTDLQPPSSGLWAPTPAPMAQARAGASAVLLPDGRILVTGGASAGVPSPSAELFNPDGSFTLAPSMQFARALPRKCSPLLGQKNGLLKVDRCLNKVICIYPPSGLWEL